VKPLSRSSRLYVVAGLACLATACGGPKPDASSPSHLDVPKLATSAPAKPGAAPRDVSEAIRAHWPFDEKLQGALYADVDAMMKMDLFRALAQAPEEKCLDDVLKSAKEIAIGFDVRGVLAIGRFGDPFPEAALRACIGKTGDKSEKKLTLTLAPPLAFLGDASLVEAAAAGATGKWPSSVAISQDQVVAWVFQGEGASAHGGVHASKERFRADAVADVPEELGVLVEEQLGRANMLGPIAKALKVERRGRRLSIVFELREPPVEQARDLGILGALAAHGVRSYLTRAKAAEARNTVAAIARDYVSDWEREDPKPRAKRKLVSYPPVPKTVPRGTTYTATSKDWAPWKALRFEMTSPQRYQYEIIAAKDGESAEIVARGDLNGDGRTSLFKVAVKIDRAKDVLVVAPTISETDPDE
jgi:hypothetical protein